MNRSLIISAIAGLLLAACAVQSSPQGGPKDITPPSIVKQEPALGALNFQGNAAVLVFDEYIQSKNLRQVMSSSPEIEDLEWELSGKRIQFSWPEGSLRENTTYRISLGDAVGDLNENNTIANLEFVWSTGATIDSMRFEGQVVGSILKEIDGLNVWLLPVDADTLATPDFSLIAGKKGEFSLAYLPAATYDVLAFRDLNFNGHPDTLQENIGFVKGVTTSSDSVLVEVPFVAVPFEQALMDTASQDSLRLVLDTTNVENLGVLELQVPPHEQHWFFTLAHENGYLQHFYDVPHEDTTSYDLGKLFAGKYTVKGFIDLNEDGAWNKASWSLNRPAEPLLPENAFELKANWELEQTLKSPE